MPSISQLVRETEVATIDVKGLELKITYLPNRLTMHRQADLQQRVANEDITAVCDMVAELLESWDMTGPLEDGDGTEIVADGELIPVTADNLGELPAFFVMDLGLRLQELVADGPKPTRGTANGRSRKR